MPAFVVRPFRRADREQVTHLVNTHAAAVIPGATVSVNAVLSQFEREPGEVVVDPWVAHRLPLVAEQDGSVVAAALLLRYADRPEVGDGYRGAGEIRWLLFWPLAPSGNPHWHDGRAAAQAVMDTCLAQFARWQVVRHHADGAVPVPGVYGVPDQWPHVAQLYSDNGFVPDDAAEVVHLVDLATVPPPGPTPAPGLRLERTVGINGTRFSAVREGTTVGYIEVAELDSLERHPRHGTLADIGNLHIRDDHRHLGLDTWLLRQAAHWLRLGHVDRLLHYTAAGDMEQLAFADRNRFERVTSTRRGWHRPLTHDAGHGENPEP